MASIAISSAFTRSTRASASTCRNGASRAEVERAMKGHVIADAELMGRYATPVEARR
jgi:phosphatidylethanolamine-binding protein (PEBP) family uncharacterized protein